MTDRRLWRYYLRCFIIITVTIWASCIEVDLGPKIGLRHFNQGSLRDNCLAFFGILNLLSLHLSRWSMPICVIPFWLSLFSPLPFRSSEGTVHERKLPTNNSFFHLFFLLFDTLSCWPALLAFSQPSIDSFRCIEGNWRPLDGDRLPEKKKNAIGQPS